MWKSRNLTIWEVVHNFNLSMTIHDNKNVYRGTYRVYYITQVIQKHIESYNLFIHVHEFD